MFGLSNPPLSARTFFPLYPSTTASDSDFHFTPFLTMLDLNDFVTERGGDPNKIKESQRRRHAPEETVDEVIALYEEARQGIYEVRLTWEAASKS